MHKKNQHFGNFETGAERLVGNSFENKMAKPPVSPIQENLNFLYSELERLEKQSFALADKLQPVCSPVYDNVCDGSSMEQQQARMPECPISNQVIGITEKVGDISQRLANILNRLEV